MTEKLDDEAADPPGDPEDVARLICLRQLEHKSRTRAELAETLRRRGVPDSAAAAVLDRFTEVGLVDDAVYAQQWVEQRRRSHGSARRVLAGELSRKGVDPETIAEATARVDEQSEERTARELVDRKLRSLQRYDHATRARRLVGMLARKGYSAGLAYRVVGQALGRDEIIDD